AGAGAAHRRGPLAAGAAPVGGVQRHRQPGSGRELGRTPGRIHRRPGVWSAHPQERHRRPPHPLRSLLPVRGGAGRPGGTRRVGRRPAPPPGRRRSPVSRPFHVCVFCGARTGKLPRYAEAAASFGRRLGERGLALVYGGARVGLMGHLADAALGAGAPVLGVLPRALASVEVAHGGLTELVLVDGLHARKARMTAESDAFVALPGGFGTLDELFEALTWGQLGL